MKYKIMRYCSNGIVPFFCKFKYRPPRSSGYDIFMRGNTREINGRKAYYLNKYGRVTKNTRKLGN